ACPSSWPAAAFAAARSMARPTASPPIRPTGRSRPRTSPRPFIWRWASTTWRPSTPRGSRTTCWPKASRSGTSSERAGVGGSTRPDQIAQLGELPFDLVHSLQQLHVPPHGALGLVPLDEEGTAGLEHAALDFIEHREPLPMGDR